MAGPRDCVDFQLAFNWLPEGEAQVRVAFLRLMAATIEIRIVRSERRCAEVSAEEEAELRRHVAVLTAEEPLRGLAGRETISWSLPGEGSGLLAAEDLSPKGLAALKEIACFAVGKVPKLTTIAIEGAAPTLADRLGFPESC
jgi:hypothetical protein